MTLSLNYKVIYASPRLRHTGSSRAIKVDISSFPISVSAVLSESVSRLKRFVKEPRFAVARYYEIIGGSLIFSEHVQPYRIPSPTFTMHQDSESVDKGTVQS